MESIGTNQGQENSLRVTFREKVVSLSLSEDATFEDIARTLGKLSKRRYGNPVGICVILHPLSRAAT